MGKACRVKKRTKVHKKRRGFNGNKSTVYNDVNNVEDVPVNNVNTESITSVNTESNNKSVNIESNNESVNSESIINLSATSVSSQKVQNFEATTPKERDRIAGYRIIDTTILSHVISMLLCPECESSSLSLGDKVSKKQGLASLLHIKCLNCKYMNEFYTSMPCDRGFDINKRTVYTMRVLGHGHSSIEKFTSLMNMPKPMTQNNYDKVVTKIANITKIVAEGTMSDAADDIRGNVMANVVDTGVSCDGTWQRRGFSSLNGVFAAISIDSGKVLDVEPMSRSCKACFLKKDLMKTDPTSYAQWRNSHICKFNYNGSAGGMESEGAKRVFGRSIEKHNLRYVEFLGDGDSKSFLTVKETYPGVRMKKLECVGHYQKRVGTRLRNLKKKEKSLGGRGRLTDAVIDRLQNFFGVAIRQNAGNLKGMKAGVLATLFHVASSKNNNWHFPHCPTGSNSWCKYNRDKENDTKLYKPGPGLPLEIVHKIRPIFECLSKDSELEKCLHGKTQNANESFNGTIWDRIPKTNYVSLENLSFGVYDAVANFNIGMKSSVLIYEKLNMVPGVYTLRGCKRINVKRLRYAEYKENIKNKARRQILRAKKMKKNDHLVESEEKLYEAGGF